VLTLRGVIRTERKKNVFRWEPCKRGTHRFPSKKIVPKKRKKKSGKKRAPSLEGGGVGKALTSQNSRLVVREP